MNPLRILITAGPTWEPIDPVRYIANRSSGKMGAALAQAALAAGHSVTLIAGPITVPMPAVSTRIDIQTAQQMHQAVLAQWPAHDLLIMAAAVADYRPTASAPAKRESGQPFALQLEPTPDIAAAASEGKRPDQRTIGFSLVAEDQLDRSLHKLWRKHLDLLVHNPLETMDSPTIKATLLWPDGRREALASRSKADFADNLLQRALALFPSMD
jgi:phosphopantothenoylcysteine decarboxylase/phosphopantothenate--cysteine ligase